MTLDIDVDITQLSLFEERQMEEKNHALFVTEIEDHEGRESKAYQDSLGIWTVGVGWNLEANPLPEHIIDQLRDISINQAEGDARALFSSMAVSSFDELSPVRQRVLVNMSFNLGQTRLQGFRKMWAAIELEDWEAAAREMLDSKWANQVGRRATRLAEMMREG